MNDEFYIIWSYVIILRGVPVMCEMINSLNTVYCTTFPQMFKVAVLKDIIYRVALDVQSVYVLYSMCVCLLLVLMCSSSI